MDGKSRSLLDYWLRNRAAPVEESKTLAERLQQLSKLRGRDLVTSVVRQNAKAASLLPPEGSASFRRLTPESLAKIKKHAAEKRVDKEGKEDAEKVSGERRPTPRSELEAGRVLPFVLGEPASELRNVPLEDLDPFYEAQKTFNVINGRSTIFRFNAEPACCVLSPLNIVRRAAIRVLVHPVSCVLIMLTILVHFVLQVVGGPLHWALTAELVFIAIFILEAMVKILARGFCVGRFTYLRDPWNWLDFILILWAICNEFVDLGNITALRMFRLLRLLKGRGMRTFSCSLTRSVRRLMGVMIFVLCCLCFFALIGTQLFMGNLRQKCIMWSFNSTETYYNEEGYELKEFDYASFINNDTNHYFLPGQLDALVCGNGSDAGRCPEGYRCIKGGNNPNYGYTNFDSFGWSFLSMFRLMTLDFWENLYQLTMRAAGRFITVVFMAFLLGGFYLLNLILGVVAVACAEQNDAANREAQEDEEEYRRILEELKKHDAEGNAKKTKDGTSSTLAVSLAKELEEDEKPCPLGCYRCTGAFLKWNCCQSWIAFKKRVHALVMDPFFELFMTICVIMQTLFVSMMHYPMTYEFEETLAIANLVFTGIFVAEMVLKIIAMDPYHYFQVGWNIFDSLTNMLNLMEFSLADFSGLSNLLRIFRLGKGWPAFYHLLKIIQNALCALGKVCLVLAVAVMTLALVGMQLLGSSYQGSMCKITVDCGLPRWHMADLFHSFMAVFRVLCGEWIEILWDCAEVAGLGLCSIYFLLVLVLGSLLVLHLFLGLLLKSFRGDYLAAIMQEPHIVKHQMAFDRIKRWVPGLKPKKAGKDGDLKKDDLALEQMNPKKDADPVAVPIAKPESDFENLGGVNGTDAPKSKDPEAPTNNSPGDAKAEKFVTVSGKAGPQDCFPAACVKCCPFLDVDVTRGGGKRWWNFRRACYAIVEHSCFKVFITVILFLCCGAMAFEDIYYGQRQVFNIVLAYAEIIFICIFIIEMLLKWAAYGFKTYFSSGWCWLEFVIVNISVAVLAGQSMGYFGFGGHKVLRALRLLSCFEGPLLVFTTLLGTIPHLVNALLASLTLWLIFAIMGVSLFAGKFYHCINTTSEEVFQVEVVDNRTECLMLMEENFTEVRWVNAKVNFDHVSNGYIALLQVATHKGWIEILYAAMDSRHVEDQPAYESNIYMFLYFVVFTFGAFNTFCLITGSYIDYYAQRKAKAGGKDLFITEEQKRSWMWTLNAEPKSPIPRPQSRIRGSVFDLVTNPAFEIVMMVLLVIYMAFLMAERDDQPELMDEIIFYASFIYILVITVECGLKIFALHHHYFTVGWNIFDFFVVVISIVGLFLSDLLEKYFVSPTLFRIVRALRLVCILRLIKRAKGISKLLLALMRSLPAIFNFALLLLIVMFIFAILGMSLFAFVIKAAGIDDMTNFETFGGSMATMFQITTLAGWDAFLLPTLLTPPDCDPSADHLGFAVRGNCGNRYWGIAFFCSYIVIALFIGINMFMAVILENFFVETEEVGQLSQRIKEDVEQAENERKTDKPVPSTTSDPVGEDDTDAAVIEAQPLMTSVDDSMDKGDDSPREVTGEVILHSTP